MIPVGGTAGNAAGRPGSLDLGIRFAPGIFAGLVAIHTLAGKTARSRAISHQRPARRVAGWRTASPPTISATPEIATDSFFGNGGGVIAS